LTTLTGHSGSVYTAAFSPDGTWVVSGSSDNTLRLWDAVSGAHLKTLTGHSETVPSVAFSPDGTRVVSGSYDNTLRLWDVVSGAHLKTLTGHSDSTLCLAFSPDGMCLVSACRDFSLTSTWHTDIRFDTFTRSVTSAVYSLDLSQPSMQESNSVVSIADCPPTYGFIIEDGWIFSLPQKRRLCWLPLSCRPRLAWTGNRIALGTRDGRVVILDFTGMYSYLDAL